jgi:hypothetical protein
VEDLRLKDFIIGMAQSGFGWQQEAEAEEERILTVLPATDFKLKTSSSI